MTVTLSTCACSTPTPHVPSLPLAPGALIFRLMQTVITVMLNGETRALDGPVSVAGLLLALGLEGRKVAVERNEAIVLRSCYAETWLASGDSLEIVHFIGGG
jgi:sulfur carrier protein